MAAEAKQEGEAEQEGAAPGVAFVGQGTNGGQVAMTTALPGAKMAIRNTTANACGRTSNASRLTAAAPSSMYVALPLPFSHLNLASKAFFSR